MRVTVFVCLFACLRFETIFDLQINRKCVFSPKLLDYVVNMMSHRPWTTVYFSHLGVFSYKPQYNHRSQEINMGASPPSNPETTFKIFQVFHYVIQGKKGTVQIVLGRPLLAKHCSRCRNIYVENIYVENI